MQNLPSSSLSHEEISARAHTIWIQAGRPDGRDLENWLQAEAELRKEGQIMAGTTAQTSAQPAPPRELVGATARGGNSANSFRRAASGAKKNGH